MSIDIDHCITVARVAGIEELIDSGIETANISSMRMISRIYCELSGVSHAELDTIPPADITAAVVEFRRRLAEPAAQTAKYEMPPITIPVLIKMEDTMGVPFYGGADLDRLKNQLVCVKIAYELSDVQMHDIRALPYPDYLANVWVPLRDALFAALVPPDTTTPDEDDAKNP